MGSHPTPRRSWGWNSDTINEVERSAFATEAADGPHHMALLGVRPSERDRLIYDLDWYEDARLDEWRRGRDARA